MKNINYAIPMTICLIGIVGIIGIWVFSISDKQDTAGGSDYTPTQEVSRAEKTSEVIEVFEPEIEIDWKKIERDEKIRLFRNIGMSGSEIIDELFRLDLLWE